MVKLTKLTTNERNWLLESSGYIPAPGEPVFIHRVDIDKYDLKIGNGISNLFELPSIILDRTEQKTIMNEAWLIYEDDGCSSYYGNFRVYTDETLALETYMSLVEEDIYWGFLWMVQDELEDRPVEEIAKSIYLQDAIWRVQKCPLYSTSSSCYTKPLNITIGDM